MRIVFIADHENTDRVNNLIIELSKDPNNQIIKVIKRVDIVYILDDDIEVRRT